MKTTVHNGVMLRSNGDGFQVNDLPIGVQVIQIKDVRKDAFGEYRGIVTVSSELDVIDTSFEPGYDPNYDRVFLKIVL